MDKMKIGVCIDVFDSDAKITARVREILAKLSERRALVVEPVYVLSRTELGIQSDLILWEHYLQPVTKAAEEELKKLSGDRWETKELQILAQDSSSLSSRTQRLAAYARERGLDLLLTGTHGRKGVDRFVLGSFAEALLLHGSVPVLTASSAMRLPLPSRPKVLFATDLSESSEKAFDRVLPLVKSLGLGVELLYVVPPVSEAVIQSGVYLVSGGWLPALAYFNRDLEAQEKKMRGWAEKAKTLGVEVEPRIDRDSPGVLQGILKAAETNPPLFVALAGKSGALSAAVLGSVTRELARACTVPVLVERTS